MDNIIYGLVDPRSDSIFYVGKSSRGPAEPIGYITSAHRGSTQRKVKAVLRAIHKADLKAEWVILEQCEHESQLNDLERFCIANFRASGAQIVNMTNGGDGVPIGTKPWNYGKTGLQIGFHGIHMFGDDHWTRKPGGREKSIDIQSRPAVKERHSKSVSIAKNTEKGLADNRKASAIGVRNRYRKIVCRLLRVAFFAGKYQ